MNSRDVSARFSRGTGTVPQQRFRPSENSFPNQTGIVLCRQTAEDKTSQSIKDCKAKSRDEAIATQSFDKPIKFKFDFCLDYKNPNNLNCNSYPRREAALMCAFVYLYQMETQNPFFPLMFYKTAEDCYLSLIYHGDNESITFKFCPKKDTPVLVASKLGPFDYFEMFFEAASFENEDLKLLMGMILSIIKKTKAYLLKERQDLLDGRGIAYHWAFWRHVNNEYKDDYSFISKKLTEHFFSREKPFRIALSSSTMSELIQNNPKVTTLLLISPMFFRATFLSDSFQFFVITQESKDHMLPINQIMCTVIHLVSRLILKTLGTFLNQEFIGIYEEAERSVGGSSDNFRNFLQKRKIQWIPSSPKDRESYSMDRTSDIKKIKNGSYMFWEAVERSSLGVPIKRLLGNDYHCLKRKENGITLCVNFSTIDFLYLWQLACDLNQAFPMLLLHSDGLLLMNEGTGFILSQRYCQIYTLLSFILVWSSIVKNIPEDSPHVRMLFLDLEPHPEMTSYRTLPNKKAKPKGKNGIENHIFDSFESFKKDWRTNFYDIGEESQDSSPIKKLMTVSGYGDQFSAFGRSFIFFDSGSGDSDTNLFESAALFFNLSNDSCAYKAENIRNEAAYQVLSPQALLSIFTLTIPLLFSGLKHLRVSEDSVPVFDFDDISEKIKPIYEFFSTTSDKKMLTRQHKTAFLSVLTKYKTVLKDTFLPKKESESPEQKLSAL